MKIFISIILFIVILQQATATNTWAYQLNGDVKIGLNEGLLETNFVITNFEEKELDELTFVLSDIFEVKAISLNNKNIDFTSSDQDCSDCNYYNISLNKTTKTDILTISATGDFLSEEKAGRKDSKGLISLKNGILRASEQAKWYPVIVSDRSTPDFNIKASYTYDINVQCEACKHVFVGDGVPQEKQGNFQSVAPQDAILLIAGDYDFMTSDYGIYLNLPASEVDVLESNIKDILAYYEQISGVKISKRLVYAYLPSDNRNWGGFVSFPVVVDVAKKPQVNRLHYVSHELAHFYFGDIYPPKSNLIWFYLESFAEYYSYKYLIKKDAKLLERDYKNLKMISRAQYIPFVKSIAGYQFRFVKFKKVKNTEDVTNMHRYDIGGFQLLGVEEAIGEEKMQALIPRLFQNLNNQEHGYTTLLNTFKEIGIDEGTINKIEKNYFNRLKYKKYNFVKEKINAAQN